MWVVGRDLQRVASPFLLAEVKDKTGDKMSIMDTSL